MMRYVWAVLLWGAVACGNEATPSTSAGSGTDNDVTASTDIVDGSDVEEPAVLSPVPVTLSRLTQAQYRNAIRDLLGDDISLPSSLEPDTTIDGLLSAGSSVTTVSPRGVELYEEAARSLSAQAVETEERREKLVPCSPSGTTDEICLREFIETFGLRVWRRPVTQKEADVLVALGQKAATALDDFYMGVSYVLSALLQSPHFLYRVEFGETHPDDSEKRRFTSWEMASRLSFFLWNTTPDEALLAAAKAGDLVDDALLKAQVDRLVADQRVGQSIRNFFAEWLHLNELYDMRKDPNVFKHYSSELGAMARNETLLLVDHLFVDGDRDFRDFFTTRTTFVNRRLAALYNVPASVADGFGPIELPASGQRRGFLGHVSFLGLHSHVVNSSATLRGMFLRESLLCDHVPPPPANLNTGIPEPTKDAKTLRERLIVHMEEPFCATCHEMIDLPGLGFENFDGMGRFRLTEQDAIIDPSGDLDGAQFNNFQELAEAVANSPKLTRCLVQKLFTYASGHPYTAGEYAAVAQLTTEFEADGRRFKQLMINLAMSEGFRRAGEVE